ncbi:MAG TPA: hypothetical protein VKX16_09045 [Chloroflexota bacterium]|nr:hypothetical protein [Chloroflexota bacterium]
MPQETRTIASTSSSRGAPTVAPLLRATALAQGLYYAVTGFWPLLSIGTFQLVTGPKRDLWLVKAAGALIGVIGAVLAVAGVRRRVTPELPLLGIGAAASLAGIDLVYVRRRVILPIYLLDAVAEIGLIGLWLAAVQPGLAAGWRRITAEGAR